MAPGIAQQLWNARHGGRTVSADTLGVISDHTAAYALQTAVTSLSRAVVVGWKLGATSAASQKAFGLSGPFYGPLLTPFCHTAGTTVRGAAAFGPGAEGDRTRGRDHPPHRPPQVQQGDRAGSRHLPPHRNDPLVQHLPGDHDILMRRAGRPGLRPPLSGALANIPDSLRGRESALRHEL